MTRGQKTWTWIGAAVVIAGGTAAIVRWQGIRNPRVEPVELNGVVLIDDTDPRKQLPVANAEVNITGGLSSADGKSDSAGLFRLTLRPGVKPGDPVTVHIRHKEYRPLEIENAPGNHLFVARLVPLRKEAAAKPSGPGVVIKDVRLRYSMKSITTMNVGSAAQTFEIANKGNVPCNNKPPCSPDGKWKAAIGAISLDAGEGNEFRNVRLSCIAGPCPFTKIEHDNIASAGRVIDASVRNWSDTVTFLVEAEVTRTMINDMVRQSYPVKFGQAMDFSLPATAEGPSIEAELNGNPIVFPLGPSLYLSWATCSAEVAPDHSKLYQCELKPGYEFR